MSVKKLGLRDDACTAGEELAQSRAAHQQAGRFATQYTHLDE